jgi:hypothetical protein
MSGDGKKYPTETIIDFSDVVEEQADSTWKKVGQRLSEIGWDESGNLVNLKQAVPFLLVSAQQELAWEREKELEQEREQVQAGEDFWADLEETGREADRAPITILDTKTNSFFSGLVRRRDNDFYRNGMAYKFVKQIQEENIFTYGYVAKAHWKMYQKHLYRDKVRHKTFPQPNDIIIVVSSLGNRAMPEHWEDQQKMFDEWIARIPNKKCIGGTKDFGGRYAGSKPMPKKHNEPGRYRIYVTETYLARNALEKHGGVCVGNGWGGVNILNLTPEETARVLDDNFKQARRGKRKKNGGN